jgi:uncharacterized membrane protein
VRRCSTLILVPLSFALVSCEKIATLSISKSANISSNVTALCSRTRRVIVEDISEDGSVVVGKCAKIASPDEWQAFRYSQSDGVEVVGGNGTAKGTVDQLRVSGDGSAIWGTLYVKGEGSRIFRHSRSDGLQDLGSMGKASISVSAVSADGSTIVGSFIQSRGESPLLYHAYRYSSANGFEDLSAMSTESTHARAISSNGSLIVGNVDVGTSSRSSVRYISCRTFQYSSSTGWHELDVGDWGEYVFPSGISNDGSVIVGQTDFRVGFIVSFFESSHPFIHTEKGGMQRLQAPSMDRFGVTRVSGDGSTVVGGFLDANQDFNVYVGSVVSQ